MKNIFTIGFRCNVDEFLKDYLHMRQWSSPFSYMVIDFDSCINFINNNFEGFIDNIETGNSTNTFNHNRWWFGFYNTIMGDFDKYADILDLSTPVCMWNHHDLNDPTVRESLKRRIKRFQETDNKLLLHMTKLNESRTTYPKDVLVLKPRNDIDAITMTGNIIEFPATNGGWSADPNNSNSQLWNNLAEFIKSNVFL